MAYEYTWEQYTILRGNSSLSDFLIGCESVDQALARCEYYRIEPPLEDIKSLFAIVPEQNLLDTRVPDVVDPQQEQIVPTSTATKKTKVTSGSTGN